MITLLEAAQQALKSLRGYRREIGCEQPCDAERALEAALEQEQETEPKSTWQKLYETAIDQRNEAVAEVKRLLEQPEQEPVACPHRDEPRGCYRVRCQLGRKCVEPLYTHPPRREWRGLDRDETMHLMNDTAENYWADEAHIQQLARAIEAALKERNA